MQQTPRITTQQHQSRDDKQYHEKLQHVVRRGDTVQPSELLQDLQLVLDTQKNGKYFKIFSFKGN